MAARTKTGRDAVLIVEELNVNLIKDIQRDPGSGSGKPEALKHELSGLWSRRITEEHRLVCSVSDEEIVIVSCKFHY